MAWQDRQSVKSKTFFSKSAKFDSLEKKKDLHVYGTSLLTFGIVILGGGGILWRWRGRVKLIIDLLAYHLVRRIVQRLQPLTCNSQRQFT